MLGYTYGSEFDNSKLFQKHTLNKHEKNLELVIKGRLDAYICDKLVGVYVARKEGYYQQLKILPNPLKTMKGHIGFTKGKHQPLIEIINNEIKLMQESREIDKRIQSFMTQH